MDLQQEYTYLDSYNNQQHLNVTGWYNQHHQVLNRNRSEIRLDGISDFSLNALGLPIDSRVLKQNKWKIMQKLNEFQTVEEFLSWMRQRFQLSIPKDKFCDPFDFMQETSQNHDYYSRKDQDLRSHYQRGVQSGFMDKVCDNSEQDMTFNEAYTCLKGSYQNQPLSSVIENCTNHKYIFASRNQYIQKDTKKHFPGKKQIGVVKDVETITDQTIDNLRTGEGIENRKRKLVQKKHEVLDLTCIKTLDIPLNLSKNASQIDENVNMSIEDDDIYFAPYYDYESDFECIDEHSLFAKHQKEYYRSSEAKRLKMCGREDPDNKNAKIDTNTYALKDARKPLNNHDDREESHQRNDIDSYFSNVSHQDEAIDYSLKWKNKSSFQTELDSTKDGLDATAICGDTVVFTLKTVSPSSQDNTTECYSHVSETCFKGCAEVKSNKNVKDTPVKNASSKRGYSLRRVMIGKSDKNLACVGKDKTGYINSVAKLGFCFPMAQNKVSREKKSVETEDFHVAPIYKTLSKEWFETLLKECMRSLNEKMSEDQDDLKSGETLSGKQRKTLEDVIDTLITEMMQDEEDF